MQRLLSYIGGALLLYLLCFHQIDNLVVNLWDESRLAINAVEMHLNGNWLVTHFEGKPDLWNTKPPLAIWLQVISFKFFGINELALRLPTAIAVCLTALLLWYLPKAHLKNDTVGVLAALILLNSNGYFCIHVSRTADYEAVLILWLVAAAFSWFLYTETNKARWLWVGCLFLTLGALTKSVQALLILPGVFAYFLISGSFKSAVRRISLYTGILTFIVAVCGYYLLREQAAPGYLETVWVTDMAGRYGTSLEGHQHPWYWYLAWLAGAHFFPWVLLLVCFPFIRAKITEPSLDRLGLFCLWVGGLYQAVILFSQTKTGWYDAPSFPFFAVVAAISFYTTVEQWLSGRAWRWLLYVLVLLPFTAYRIYNITTVRHDKQPNEEFGLSKLAQAIMRKQFIPESKELHFCLEGYAPQLAFYRHALLQHDKNLVFITRDAFQPGQVIYTCQERVKTDTEQVWEHTKEELPYGVVKFKLIARKEKPENQE